MLLRIHLCILTVISIGSALPIEKAEDPDYHIPATVDPKNYNLELKLADTKFETFSGTVAITFQVVPDQTIKEIKLHSKELTLNELTLKNGDTDIAITSHAVDDVTNILTIATDTELTSGIDYVLRITFDGHLNIASMHGFYRSTYDDGTKVLATTQFESTHAREAFPCFDEPSFKASFDISILYPDGYKVFGNTLQKGNIEDVDGLKKITLEQTPDMSTYLIAFIISEFDCQVGASLDDIIPTNVCSRVGTAEFTKVAVDLSPKVLKVMEDYTGFSYVDTKIGKMTQVAIPDFAAGAMENWGLVTFREAALLWDENESSDIYKQRVVTVIAHEFAHQWFGDLVTLNWWSNIFLNEGFATYFEYHTPANIEEYEDWELPRQFVVEQLQTAFKVDDTLDSKPLSFDVEIPEEISERFDSISYNKGGSILRMVQHFLTLPNFKLGLKDYIDANKFDNGDPTKLWSSFETHAQTLPEGQKPPAEMVAIMDNWTNKAGFPLVTVKTNGNNVVITQERFLSSQDETDDTKWYVPISYTLSSELETNVGTTVRNWLVPDSDLTLTDILADNEWIILNNQQTGYYRIDYDNDLWSKIAAALDDDPEVIDDLNRAQLVDDLFSLAQANKKSYGDVFRLISFLRKDLSYYSWTSALNGFSTMLSQINNEKLRTSLQGVITELISYFYNARPFQKAIPPTHLYIITQNLALTWGCQLNIAECVTTAKEQFAKIPAEKPERNKRNVVYCNGLRYSDDIETDWNTLWTAFGATDSSTEQVTIINALGCATDATILDQYLRKTISADSGIRMQDANYAFKSVYNSNPIGVDVTLDFIIDAYTDILTYFEDEETLTSLITAVAAKFTNDEQVRKLQDFANVHDDLAPTILEVINKSIEKANLNLEKTKALEEQLTDYFSEPNSAVNFTAFSLTMLMSLIMFAINQL